MEPKSRGSGIVCLSVANITQKVMDWILMKFQERVKNFVSDCTHCLDLGIFIFHFNFYYFGDGAYQYFNGQ